MGPERTGQRATAAIERRPPPAMVQRSAAPATPSAARALHERLGNRATQALIARSVATPAKETAESLLPVHVPPPQAIQLAQARRLPTKVSQPNDPAELEAEETARKVVRM